MTPESVMSIAHQAMYVALLLAAPLLLVALVVGLVVSLFQAATQINESTLSFIPKLLAVALTLVICRTLDDGNAARLHAPRFHHHARHQPAKHVLLRHLRAAQYLADVVPLAVHAHPRADCNAAPLLSHQAIPIRVKVAVAAFIGADRGAHYWRSAASDRVFRRWRDDHHQPVPRLARRSA